MKKIIQVSAFLLAAGFLTACSTPKGQSASSESTTESTVQETSTTVADDEAITLFTATVESVTDLELNEPSIQILLKDAKAVEDEEGVVASFQEGVALNLSPEMLDFEVEVGDELKVGLHQPAVMTMSLPPQIPGNSIESVELVK